MPLEFSLDTLPAFPRVCFGQGNGFEDTRQKPDVATFLAGSGIILSFN